MKAYFSMRLACWLVLLQICHARFFQDGFDHHYVYKAKSDYLGMHNVTTIMKFHVRNENQTDNGDLLNALWLDSFVQFTQAGQYAENPLNWNLSRPFLFAMSPTGIVLLVHTHPDEANEVLTLKKVLSSTFSANVVISNKTKWTYTSVDNDHIGNLSHEYTAERTNDGMKISRFHQSVDTVERIHTKVMDLDHRGTVKKVDAEDSILLENRLNKDFETKRVPYPEEYVIKTREEGEIGKIRANAVVNMKLVSKRRITTTRDKTDLFHGLQAESDLQAKQIEIKESLEALQNDIDEAIECTHNYPDKSATNRTVCVNTLRQKIDSLQEDDYMVLATRHLSKVCVVNDTRCEDERLLFVDIVSRGGDPLSQRLAVTYVLQNVTMNEEEVRRALIHFTTLKEPVWESVSAVEALCFGQNNEHHGAVNMTLTVQRACLALGVLAKAYRNNGNDTAAAALVEKLHSWMDIQGDETPEHMRPRRSINVDKRVSSHHLLSKFVLLHSLGNAAHPTSVPHLSKYATPNARIPAWRRAALESLKFDKSHKSAEVMLKSLALEEVETVRATAMEQFLQHPLQRNFSRHLGDILLSQNYSYPNIVRLRRSGDLNDVLLEFKVELPEVHWGKSVGNAAIGASFGVDMVNRMHLRIKPLSGFFHINVWDRVFAEAHMGIIGLHVDILRIEACYKGKIEYNLNILKDFSYGEAQNDFDDYDKAAGAIVGPIVSSVQDMTEQFKTGRVFQPITDAVKSIPEEARRFLDASIALVKLVDQYQGLPLVSRVRLLAFKLQSLAEDIKGDALNFYNEVADTALIALPHAETQLTEAANMIVEAQKKLGKTPQQSFDTINKAKSRIKAGTFQLIKAKSNIQEALSPHGGSLPTWISSTDEIKLLSTAAETLLAELQQKVSTFSSVSLEEADDMVDWQGLRDIQDGVQSIITELRNLSARTEPFHTVFADSLKIIQNLKLSVDQLDKTTKETQTNVKKNFGPKFNKGFPAQRRAKDNTCGKGELPSTTNERYEDSPGIDVIVEYGWKVTCPVNGKVFRTCEDDEVRIVPTDDNFKMFNVLIRNINPDKSISAEGSEFKSGQTLGTGKGKSGCSEPYIHVAMRKNSEGGGAECSYVDPSSYVDNIQPFPKWKEECKEFTFKHIGNIIEAGLSGLGFEEIIEKLAVRALAWADADVVKKIVSTFPKSTFAKMAGTMTYAYLSQYNSEIANAFMASGDQASLMNEKCDQMSKTTTPTPEKKAVMTSASPGKQNLKDAVDNLKANPSAAMDRQLAQIETAMEKLKNSSSGIQLDDIQSMAFNKLGMILRTLDIPSKGSKQSMETTIQMLSWKVCPTFENGIAQGYGHMCIPNDNCLGLQCLLRVPDGIMKMKLYMDVLFEPGLEEFRITSAGKTITLRKDEPHKASDMPNLLPDHEVVLLLSSQSLNVSIGTVYQLSLSAVVCDWNARCLPNIHIFHNLTFLKQQKRQIRSLPDSCSFSGDVGVDGIGHVGGSLEVDKDGHVKAGGVEVGVQVKDVELNGGFHINDKGQWGADAGVSADLGDGASIGTQLTLEGDGNKISYGVGVDDKPGDTASIGGFVQGNSDGELTAGVNNNVQVGSTNVSAGGWIHHDKNGTSGGGSLAANIDGKGEITASLNASSDGTIDAGLSGNAQIGNSTIGGASFVHHDKNGTSGGGSLTANIDGKREITASLNASSDGTIDAGLSGNAQIGNSTIGGAAFVHHDKNGTGGGGSLAANIDDKGQIAASLNASADGTIDAGLSGNAQIGNSTIGGAAFVHHDANRTSGGGSLTATIDGRGEIAASLNASSDGTIDAGLNGNAQIGNSTIGGAAFVHHDTNGTSGGGALAANIDGKGEIAASLNASSDGTIDAGLNGNAQIGNSTMGGSAFVHHHANGTSGGGSLAANIDGKGEIAASLNASSDGTIDAGLSGNAQIGNSTIGGAAFVHHDDNGTSGGGALAANIDGKGEIAASLNASSDGTIDAGLGGNAQMGNSTIGGSAFVHHDANGTSGGGALAANIDGKGEIAASLNASSDGTIDAGLSGNAQIGNSTIGGTAFVHHDANGTSGGGSLAANIDGKGEITASLNASSDGTIDAGLSGNAQIGNSTIGGAAIVHHDANGTAVAGNIAGKGPIGMAIHTDTDGSIEGGLTEEIHISKRSAISLHFIPVKGETIPQPDQRNEDMRVLREKRSDKFSVGVDATIPGLGSIGFDTTFKDGQLVGDIKIGDFSFDIAEAKYLAMDTFAQLAGDFNIDDGTAGVVSGMREGMSQMVCKSETEMSFTMETDSYEEDSPARDKKDGVTYKDRHTDITIFKISHTFGVGPIGIKLAFGAGGAIGTAMWTDIHANKGTAAFSIGPWVSGMIWGGISIELGIASGGLKLIGYILKTKFPITMETKSNAHPLTVVMKIDLELTPIELHLRGWVKVFFSKVFDKAIWKWACEPITWNILTKELQNKDNVPPAFVTGTYCGDYITHSHTKVTGCSIQQVKNRHPTDTAFQLGVVATDDDSSVKTWYAIGFQQGSTDVQAWTKFKGNNLVVPAKLPNGVPLYFMVKAKNEQGLESVLQCHITTYDNTSPAGRIEASHQCSSHPHIISATAIVVEDSPITKSYKALGLSPGRYGREVRTWTELPLSKTSSRPGVSSTLGHFSVPRRGAITLHPLEEISQRTPEDCARHCLGKSPCLSFNFDQISETCQLLSVVENHYNTLHIKGEYKNYERLGSGFTAYIEYNHEQLEHGKVYYVNVLIENSLGYQSPLFSEGTMVDFTPPETGYLGAKIKDVTVPARCTASVRQLCDKITDIPNHRKIIDGPDGRTVFSGNKPLYDEKYTLTNHFVTGNWDGFSDSECGLNGFTWSVGTTICGEEIVKYNDPHKHITSPKYWTYSGFQEDVSLPDGQYYITVQAINNIVFGGALVTTVCHSVPFTVDTTPPVFYNVTDVMFDEDFDILAAYYNVSDEQSQISRIDFGLGLTKHDVGLRAYSRHSSMERIDPYLVVENLQLQPGVPAWVRIRAVNNVGLFASGHARAPIMVDKTPPLVGVVYDGDQLRKDIQYQHNTETICAQWIDFYDPESGIRRFIWGVGTAPESDDVIAFQNVSRFEKQACSPAHLSHNTTYYSTIVALNDALNSRRSNGSSDGVLVDTTRPLQGFVHDRDADERYIDDIEFSSETGTISAKWYNFTDPESGIAAYNVDISINAERVKTVHMATKTMMVDHTLTLKHLDTVEVKVTATNGARLEVSTVSDGFLVDQTPPVVEYIRDTENGSRFQADKSTLYLGWSFTDDESGIAEYRYQITELSAGIKSTIYPVGKDFEIIKSDHDQKESVELTGLHLTDGALYKLHIIALNRARLSASFDSEGVLVDSTPPIVKQVIIAMPKEEEDLDETDTYVLLAGPDRLTVTWNARDSESGIEQIHVAIGTNPGDTSVTNGYRTYDGKTAYAEFTDIGLQYYTDASPIIYYVSVIVNNKAGIPSDPVASKPIKVLHENVPGTVYDGRRELEDKDFTRDKSSLGISFNGFESETCNIVGYEWAIGSEPYLTDFMPFTDYGIAMMTESHGHAQIHLELYDSQTYYATVRARTGQECKQRFILSSSNGITLDKDGPNIHLNLNGKAYQNNAGNLHLQSMETVYQQSVDTLNTTWQIDDPSGIQTVTWRIGTLPGLEDVHPTTPITTNFLPVSAISMHPGKSNFISIEATDNSGVTSLLITPAITVDTTVPLVRHLVCTKVLSKMESTATCSWSTISDTESLVVSISFSIGSTSLGQDIVNATQVYKKKTSWKKDVGFALSNDSIKIIHMALHVKNAAGKEFVIENSAVVDRTPPLAGIIRIVTSNRDEEPTLEKQCQESNYYIEMLLTGFKDDETEIDRYEVALGRGYGLTDISDFYSFGLTNEIAVGGLQLTTGEAVFATVKVFNKVGLYSTHSSQAVIISPSPMLRVYDGDSLEDKDFISHLNLIQGRWHYSDPCPIMSAEWSVEDLTGNVIQEFKHIVNANSKFLNDEILTKNSQTYINIIRTTDSLNRTKEARSDGITIRIQTPKLGNVRDGLETDDINYQSSTTELSCNWDSFGDQLKGEPSQTIIRYEVAVGNDRRFQNTRTNVHTFVDVGLNTSMTLSDLDLVAKQVRYYYTVRAHSAAGSFIEGYSNGIRVGYEKIIEPGKMEYERFQASIDSVVMAWTDFISDYGIRHYEIAITSNLPELTHDTIECGLFRERFGEADVYPLQNVAMDTYRKITGLRLHHGFTFYVTVVAEDETGSCIAETSEKILVDTTPPTEGSIFLNGREVGIKFNYISSPHRLVTSWQGYTDIESGIAFYRIKLYKYSGCNLVNNTLSVEQEQTVNTTEILFLNLEKGAEYIFELSAINGANLNYTTTTAVIRIDDNDPNPGKVKAGSDWLREISVQQSATTLNATLLIAANEESYMCPLQTEIRVDKYPPEVLGVAEGFLPGCVSYLHNQIIIEARFADADLSTIVKGGVRWKPQLVAEGTYTFHLAALHGPQMVSCIALTPAIENIPVDFNEDVSMAEQSDNTTVNEDGESPLADRNRFGVGILIPGYRLGNKTDEWYVLFWAADMYKFQQEWVRIDFDPTTNFAKYDIALTKENTTAGIAWNVMLSINEKDLMSAHSLAFQEKFDYLIYGFNKNNYVPPAPDTFHPFLSTINVSSILVPKQQDVLCKYGQAFYDGQTGIHEVWAAVSTSQNETETVAPYTLQHSFCLACKTDCKSGCDDECPHRDPLEVIPISLSNLNLLPSSNASHAASQNISSGDDFNTLQTESYFINIKVVDFAGHQIETTSGAIIVDDTPPEITTLFCVDPLHSMNEPARYQGTNESVAAYWEARDDISRIQMYTLCVGTSEGSCDIIRQVNAELRTSLVVHGLEDRLMDGTTYYLTLTAYNEAEMQTSKSCNITVELAPPETEDSGSTEMFSITEEDTPEDVVISNVTDRLGIQWSVSNDDTEFFEWELGTSTNVSDIFPRVKIGTKNSRKAAIIDGHLWLDGININTTVKEYVLTNWTENELANAKTHGAFLNLEPGRCVHINLYSVNRAHLSSKIPVKPICMKRTNDLLINFDKEPEITIIKTGNKLIKKQVRAHGEEADLSIRLKGVTGALMMGLLEPEDMEKSYGSAASDEYKSFIASPLVHTETSRLLRKRLNGYSGVSFYAAPTGALNITEDGLTATLRFNATGDENIPALIFWDTDKGKWRHIEEGCVTDQHIDYGSQTYTANICLTSRPSSRRRRSLQTVSSVNGPRQFSLVFISKEIQETAPVINTATLHYSEDPIRVELKAIQFTDAEGDDVTFNLIGDPNHGYANISADGQLFYKPAKDFAGTDEIVIECVETSLSAGMTPVPVRAKVQLFVSEVNDAPDLAFFRDNTSYVGMRYRDIILPFEANTTGYYIGAFVESDIDIKDTLTQKTFETGPNDVNFTLTEISDQSRLSAMMSEHGLPLGNTVKGYDLNLEMSSDFYGVLDYGLMVHDKVGHWSLPVTLKVGILYSPCIYGTCASRDTIPCTDMARAESFEHFRCACQLGYEGEWCETETNECAPQPCALMFDCEDLIAGYQCNINLPKLMAILVCSLLAMGLVGFALYKKKQQYKQMMKVNDMCLNDLSVPTCNPVNRYNRQNKYEPFLAGSGINLPEVGSFRPPHHPKTVFTKMNGKTITPIDV